ncbi:PREDICTED: uncharacterized protein LOC109580360 [Amphimedon queenslandica]|uniref:COR domain-containing protein n=1 Tax=Amphimedon queenslandica TaxID=400682 RepID=A0A1X7VH90_AMPQE|nr:PREDICTED: uncharacterized protein LOC109580360 [Amphimedon queenslandica]|eukprot:XP_019848970.1 PREDICTED: uncharacterized protein LOC109580360 [Amphimedon queenslandica]
MATNSENDLRETKDDYYENDSITDFIDEIYEEAGVAIDPFEEGYSEDDPFAEEEAEADEKERLTDEFYEFRKLQITKGALAEGQMDVAYSRVLFLGTAGVGKTSFKRSLMKLPWKPNTTSTIISNISKVRPFTHKWHTVKDEKWKVATHEDEIEELAHLILAVFKNENTPISTYFSDFKKKTVQSIPNGIEDEIISQAWSRANSLKPSFSLEQPLLAQPFLHFWDCGGQQPFLEILPVFLTSRTLFFIIFDAEKDLQSNWKSVLHIDGTRVDQEEGTMTTLDYMLNWMANIHGHLMIYDKDGGVCEYPRMYCIGTHGDCITEKRKLEIKHELEHHYEGKDYETLMKATAIVDNTTSGQGEAEDSSFGELREAVIKFTTEKLIVKTPVSWVLFRKVLQVLSKNINVINLTRAYKIGVASKIPQRDVPHVLTFYHELGVLLFYPQLMGMKDSIVINPKYFVGALGEIFPLTKNNDSGYQKEWKLFHEFGILVQPLYVEVWKRHKDLKPVFFIEVLVYFRLAVEVKTDKYPPSSKQYFMPLVLQSKSSDEIKLLATSCSYSVAPIHITFSSGYVPPGFFTRFIAVVTDDPNTELCLEDGVYRNCVSFRYQHLYSKSIEHILVTDRHNVIQINVSHHPASSDSLSVHEICQNILSLLQSATQEVADILEKCGGCPTSSECMKYVVTQKFQYICTNCSSSSSLHYLKTAPTKQTTDVHVCCSNDRKYRPLTDEERVWFEDPIDHKKSDQANLSTEHYSGNNETTRYICASKASNTHLAVAFSEDIGSIMEESSSPNLCIEDLDDVIEELSNFDVINWQHLGLHLGLYDPTLKAIEENCRGKVRKCLMECMAAWLRGEDKVIKKGGSNWLSLVAALNKSGEQHIANDIKKKFCKFS